jgi:hypothetical protein
MVIAAAPATAAARVPASHSAAPSASTPLAIGLIGSGLLLLGVACLVFAAEPRAARQAHRAPGRRRERRIVQNYPESANNSPDRRDYRRAP